MKNHVKQIKHADKKNLSFSVFNVLFYGTMALCDTVDKNKGLEITMN